MIDKDNLLEVLRANGLDLESEIISGEEYFFIKGLPTGSPELMYDQTTGSILGKFCGQELAALTDLLAASMFFETLKVRVMGDKEASNLSLYSLAMEGFLDAVATDFNGKVYGIPLEFTKDHNVSITAVKDSKEGKVVLIQRGFSDYTYYLSANKGGAVKWLTKKEWPSEAGGLPI
jgi:hypothetical protein